MSVSTSSTSSGSSALSPRSRWAGCCSSCIAPAGARFHRLSTRGIAGLRRTTRSRLASRCTANTCCRLRLRRCCCWWLSWARSSWPRRGFEMAEITTLHYLVVAAALFIVGTIGVLTRRNVVIILMSIELILNAVNLNLVAFSRLYGLQGQVFSIFVITDAAAEAAVGLGIIIAFFRNKETVNVDEVDLLKW